MCIGGYINVCVVVLFHEGLVLFYVDWHMYVCSVFLILLLVSLSMWFCGLRIG